MIAVALRTTSPAAVAKIRAKAPIAIVRALNRAIDSTKTIMLREVSGDIKVKIGDLRDKITVQRARPDLHRARLYASPKRIPLIDFGATGPEPSRGRGRGVTARLTSSRARYPNAFIATMKSGHRGVYRRGSKAGPSKSRLPIRELFGPSIAHVFARHEDVGLARGIEQLRKNLQSEFRFALAIEAPAA